MKREVVIERLKDMKADYLEYGPKKDAEVLEYAINQLKKEDSKKCDCCTENNYVLVVDNIKLCKECLERLKEISL